VESRLGGVLGTLETLLGPEAAGLNLDLSA
jgi:hypothetical protein